jgi:peptidoglycan/xylan/chitin deacetylase (PgdA/CDA1 family)
MACASRVFRRQKAFVSGILNVGKRALFGAGHYHRALAGERFPGVAVLAYHGLRADDWRAGSMPLEELHVRASTFESHCRVVRETCHPISLDDWRRARAGTGRLPDRPVLITFDDGYRSVLTLGLPILRKYDLPAAVFCCSVPNAERRLLWWDYIADRDGDSAIERWKDRSYDEWLAECVLAAHLTSDEDPRATLTPAEVRDLAGQSGIEIGSHTARHPILARAPITRQRDELVENRTTLEVWTGRPVRALAYPNGRRRVDYTEETLTLVADLNFDFAFTTESGFATAGDSSLEQPRFVMLSSVTGPELAHRLAYAWKR